MRPIERGAWPTKGKGTNQKLRVFNKWQRAKRFLVERTGDYCHLCEMRVNNALAIEHILPKEHFPDSKSQWDNFLLICSYCNSRKGDRIPQQPIEEHYLWPHLHDTHLAFEYEPITGQIFANPGSDPKGMAAIQLYGLDKEVKSTGESDDRFMDRLKAAGLAIQYLLEFVDGDQKPSLRAIASTAAATGFFSTWLKVFEDFPEIRMALIAHPAFHLGDKPFFDQNANPIPRNGTQI